MTRFKESVKDYLSFTKNERTGIISLLFVCVVLLILWIGKDAFIASQKGDLRIKYIQEEPDTFIGSEIPEIQQELKLFYFDPNNLPANEWRKLGLSDKQINGIHNYEKAGGSFKTKADVQKMYTISDEKFKELEPYIKILGVVNAAPNEPLYIEKIREQHEPFSSRPAATLVIDLNSADTLELIELKGIGPVFAKNMLKYRGLLGGYYAVDQLNEVYGLREYPEVVEKVSAYLTIDTTAIRKINLNTSEAKDLASHIYIDWKVAKAIIAYRNVHGPYKKVSSVLKCHLVDDTLMTKIAPYLKVD